MPETAESLSASQTSSRNITIEITNQTDNFILLDPKVHLEAGHCHSPPQPSVRPHATEVCNFEKGSGAVGSVGVMTYDVYKRGQSSPTGKLTLMFSVPYDRNFYKNWMALGLFPMDTECDEKLYKKMYYDKEQVGFQRVEVNGSVLNMREMDLSVMVTMSPLAKSIMKVEVWNLEAFEGLQFQL
ncbi:DELTA-sagatoxin-Srs1a-like [Gouania willdenowi]|uniref:DELTA-sagatoxin-Srs1a-like n=1 Tax=Gouania willdenowi TaxID=441366 RepID=A0A8C5GT77_GOUWI|nr:DELTA-sagatoxin-Srs1a-like [Gouania willdenowi]